MRGDQGKTREKKRVRQVINIRLRDREGLLYDREIGRDRENERDRVKSCRNMLRLGLLILFKEK